MAQYDNKMYAALEADDDSPLSDNIKASAAQSATLCNNESFPAVFNISKSLLHSTFTSLTQQLSAYTPDHSANTFSHDDQHSAKFASVVSPGIGQSNETSQPLFVYICREMDRLKEVDDTASEQREKIGNSAQTESNPDHSNTDSITENTSNSTISSLYEESNDPVQTHPNSKVGTAPNKEMHKPHHPFPTSTGRWYD